MLSREKVGMRIRQVRTQQHKTLRDVESASGFSSTHISEIERGRTSPTIGALIQIAHALEKDPSYFIEERELEEVCVTAPNDRPAADPEVFDFEGIGVQLESVTQGILGGRLLAYELILEPGAEGQVTEMPVPVDICFVCLEGEFEMGVGETSIRFGAQESLHAALDRSFSIRNPGEETARVMILMDPGLSQA